MNNKNKILVLITLLVLIVSNSLFAKKYVGTIQAPVQKESATCLPATNSNQLTINNVRAYIETNGTMWFKEIAQYEIPRGSQKTSMFAAALWIGGRDVSGQLRLAAVRFRQVGDDYWTGPLTIEGASINQQTCSKYDKHFKITRAEVEAHIAAHSTGDPTYTPPSSITQWPAHGENGQSYYLAPFKDVNEDGVYDYNAGDYPYYDLANELCPWTPENIALAAQDLLPWTPERNWIQQNYGYDNKMIYSDHVLKGDETLFWIFNDKGGPHTESQGDPIGLEIRGQAFAFATNDELNNMTFYSYEIINRSTFALTNTYFSQWVDPDLGYAEDDFVGCDVLRGLGYCYNGYETDGQGLPQHYGAQPPAVGVDFFQGPYIDADDRDNPHFDKDSINTVGYCEKFVNSSELTGFVNDQMAINGVNFGDQIIDNERYGMRRFVYHDNNNTPRGDPSVAFEYYNLLQGIWGDGSRMQYGGNAYFPAGNGGPECDFMFPGDTDPCNWGTAGVVPDPITGGDGTWTEQNVGNPPFDRRFMQSAGPFTLKAGAVNYITVGIPWARASQGGAWASVELLKIADDKCQALFENCFKVLDGPDAPELTIRELDNELILYITNDDPLSNNYLEQYEETDSQIPENIPGTTTPSDKKYRFEGYQIFQLKDKDVSISEIFNTEKSRIIAQCDIENNRANGSSIGQLINWEYNDALGSSVPVEKVNGSNNGLFHTLQVTEDAFAVGSKRLVNYKNYYFIVIAYAYNEFAPFSINPDITGGLFGQKTVYLSGRKAAGGRAIKPVSGIPHPSTPLGEGTVLNSQYGTTPLITRIQGQGNGGNFVDLSDETVTKIMSGGDNNTWAVNDITYKNNSGPLSIKVIDPLKVQPLDYLIKFIESDTAALDVTNNTNWVLEFADNVTDEEIIALGYKKMDGSALRTIPSQKSVSVTNEQLFLPLGIAIDIKDYYFKIHQEEVVDWLDTNLDYRNYYFYGQVDLIGSSMEYKDPSKPWLWGVKDSEGSIPSNWIRSGVQAVGPWTNDSAQDGAEDEYEKWKQEDMHLPRSISGDSRKTRIWKDPKAQFEKINNGTWAPYMLSSPYDGGPQAKYVTPDNPVTEPLQPYFTFHSWQISTGHPGYNYTMTNLYSVDIVLTPDKSKWTRCIVLEACDNKNISQGNALRHEPRKAESVDQNGNPDGTGTGFGWFPGYAINVETGERLNLMFSEDSSLPDYNGDDMIFNPSSVWAVDPAGEAINEATYNIYRELFLQTGDPMFDAKIVWGGKHYVYVLNSVGNTASTIFRTPARYRTWNDNDLTISSNGMTHGGYFQGQDQQYYSYYDCGPYDECRWANAKFGKVIELNNDSPTSNIQSQRRQLKMQLFSNVMWTSIPMPAPSQEANWLSNEAKVKIRVTRPYMRYSSRWINNADVANSLPNKGFPMYTFTTKNIAPTTKEVAVHSSILDKINIVPNPYYGYSSYESSALETYVKVINLPENCELSIFTVNGTLVKKISKGDSGSTFVTWDLKNDAGIPIAGGIYLIHVKAPNIGERTLKFFCAMRPTDLNAF